MPQKSQVECYEHQDYSKIRHEPFPECVSEEENVHTDDDGHHRQHVKYDSYLRAHFTSIGWSVHPHRPTPVDAADDPPNSQPHIFRIPKDPPAYRRLDLGRPAGLLTPIMAIFAVLVVANASLRVLRH